MENSLINRDFASKLTTKNLQIRLVEHCIICLRKASLNRKGNEGAISESFRNDADGNSASPEIAPKSVVTTPGFLETFNQVWAVLQLKWKKRNEDKSSDKIEISLDNVLHSGQLPTNVSFSKAPTICRYCCDKVLIVENLMKAVRQQLREIEMLLEEGRRRQEGGLGDFEKNLRENGLEECVIQATLQFVGILGSSQFSQDGFKDPQDDNINVNVAHVLTKMESVEQNSLADCWIDDDDNDTEDRIGLSEGDDGDGDSDYIMSEPDDDDNESEDETDVDEEDKNDPDFEPQGEKDPLAVVPKKRIKNHTIPRKKSDKKSEANEEDESSKKLVCSCGKRFETVLKLRDHMRKNLKKHPDYKPFDFPQSKLNEKDLKYACSCGKSFATLRTRRAHVSRNKEMHPEYKRFGKDPLNLSQSCELCGEKVKRTDIEQHLKDHLNGEDEWVIKCVNEKCRFMCVSSKEFHLHLRQGLTDRRKECLKIWKEKCGAGAVCEICGFKGTNMLVIRTHVRDKHENGKEEKLECPISGCGKMFCVKQSVQFHLYEHRYRKITQQTCDKCGDDVKVEEMEGHLKDKHGIEEVIGCKQCEFKFSGRDEMVEHLYEHRRSGLSCDICGENKLSRYVDFREHYFGVHKLCPKKYKCGEGHCENWFWRKEDKEKHEENLHKESNLSVKYRKLVAERKKEFECDECQVQYFKEDNLRSHKIKVHGADPYTCDICGETFNEKGKLNKHKKEHAGIVFQTEWKCDVEGCGKTFKQKKSWKRHKEVGHGGVKPHVCDICGKGYSDPNTLKDHHNSVHLGIRSWVVCDECGERFTSGTVLKRHQLIHTGERPFGCDICGQRFRHKEVLRRHTVGHEEKGADFKPNGPMKQIRKRKAQ